MAISKKLPSTSNKVTELINKGGAVPSTQDQKIIVKNLQLRLPQDLIEKMDSYCQENRYHTKKSRHSWILEAILEKIERTEKAKTLD